jgi:flagellar protein FliO/FliZ
MEFTTYLRFILALALVVGLIFALAWVLRRFGLGGSFQRAVGRKRRLSTIESASLDARHRVVLVRRDDVEHLVLIGPNTSQVIERGIPATADDLLAPPEPRGLAVFSEFLPKDKEQ